MERLSINKLKCTLYNHISYLRTRLDEESINQSIKFIFFRVIFACLVPYKECSMVQCSGLIVARNQKVQKHNSY